MSDLITIFYAENDLAHLSLTEWFFSDLNLPCTIKHFNNGKELLDHLYETLLDKTKTLENTALLLDLNMPIMGGMEALRQIKLDPQLRDLPSVIFTTTDSQEELNKCYDLGCNGCFEKTFTPVDFMKLYDFIRRAVALRTIRN